MMEAVVNKPLGLGPAPVRRRSFQAPEVVPDELATVSLDSPPTGRATNRRVPHLTNNPFAGTQGSSSSPLDQPPVSPGKRKPSVIALFGPTAGQPTASAPPKSPAGTPPAADEEQARRTPTPTLTTPVSWPVFSVSINNTNQAAGLNPTEHLTLSRRRSTPNILLDPTGMESPAATRRLSATACGALAGRPLASVSAGTLGLERATSMPFSPEDTNTDTEIVPSAPAPVASHSPGTRRRSAAQLACGLQPRATNNPLARRKILSPSNSMTSKPNTVNGGRVTNGETSGDPKEDFAAYMADLASHGGAQQRRGEEVVQDGGSGEHDSWMHVPPSPGACAGSEFDIPSHQLANGAT